MLSCDNCCTFPHHLKGGIGRRSAVRACEDREQPSSAGGGAVEFGPFASDYAVSTRTPAIPLPKVEQRNRMTASPCCATAAVVLLHSTSDLSTTWRGRLDRGIVHRHLAQLAGRPFANVGIETLAVGLPAPKNTGGTSTRAPAAEGRNRQDFSAGEVLFWPWPHGAAAFRFPVAAST